MGFNYYCPDFKKPINLIGNLNTRKFSILTLKVSKCKNSKKSAIKCASNSEIEKKLKYLEFNFYENSEQINFGNR